MIQSRNVYYPILIFLFCVCSITSYSQNLVRCPGAETDPSANGWTLVYGGSNCYSSSSWRIPGGQSSYPSAQEGGYYFFPGCRNAADVAGTAYELYQDIDVQSEAAAIDALAFKVSFSGYARTYNSSNYDNSEMIVEYRNATNSVVLDAYNTGNAIQAIWTNYTDTRNAPAGTRFIRVRLISTYRSGTSVDSYFDNISVTGLSTLPVNLVSFKVRYNAGKAILRWETSDEVNNSGFFVQRSSDAAHWKNIEFVPATAMGTLSTIYEAVDAHPGDGITYYRLQQLDKDGHIHYSPVAILNAALVTGVSVFPNPTAGLLFFKAASTPFLVEIINSVGTTLQKFESPGSNGVSIRHLPAGIYTVKIVLANETLFRLVVKQ